MKTLKELEDIKKQTLSEIDAGNKKAGARIVVGMATCGISAGAGPVLETIRSEIEKRKLADVSAVQAGCIGVCRFEPIVEVYMPGKEKVTYVKVTPAMAARIVAEHIVNGNPITEYTIGYIEANGN